MRCIVCTQSLEHASTGFWCTTCFKVKYCSTDCEVKHSAEHQTLCTLVESLKSQISGFNHRLFLREDGADTPSAFMPSHTSYQKLYTLGKTHLKRDQHSAVCYTTHRLHKLSEIREKQENSPETPGEVWVDDIHQLVIHGFLVDFKRLKPLLRGLPSNSRRLFQDTCARPDLVERLGVPVVYFRDIWVEGENDIRLSFFLLTPTEF